MSGSMRLGRFVAMFLIAEALTGAKLYLKSRVIDTLETPPDTLIGPLIAIDSLAPVHYLVQFDHVPDVSDLQSLTERGAVIAGYVHENGLVVAVADRTALADLPLTWVGRLDASDKISPLLADDDASDPHAVLAEFHPDVSIDDARRIVADLGLIYLSNPDTGPHRLLIMANHTQIDALAARDEVAYVFPAADELVTGRPVIACAGALTDLGPAGQYIPRVGDGWGGPEHKAAALGYYFSRVTSQLPGDAVRSEIVRAFGEWSKYVQVSFSGASAQDALRTINVLFASGDHGDGYPFDGRAGALAHTFYPAPPNPEPLAGDMHFDDSESWRIGADTDLFSVALHETGHALGLGHSDRPGSVMYPYYSRVTALTQDDIAAVQSLYPAQTDATTPVTPSDPVSPSPLSLEIASLPITTTADAVNLSGTSSGGTAPITVTWSTDRGRSGWAQGSTAWSAQVPLLAGANAITITARDSRSQTVSKSVSVARQTVVASPVSIQITSPAVGGIFKTTASSVNVRGSASHTSGIRSVSWRSDRGPAGLASGTSSWDTGPIALETGANNITITATSNNGGTASQSLAILYSAGSSDTTAPSINITYPASVTSTTTAGSIVVRGTARDNVGVSSITWRTAAGASGAGAGTTSWSTSAIPLIVGYNSIQIRVYDAAGNSAWRSITVTRR